MSAALALSIFFFFHEFCQSCIVLCLQTIGVSLLLPVVKGKPSPLALFLSEELLTIPPGSLPRKGLRGPVNVKHLTSGVFDRFLLHFPFTVVITGNQITRWVWGELTCEADSYSHKTVLVLDIWICIIHYFQMFYTSSAFNWFIKKIVIRLIMSMIIHILLIVCMCKIVFGWRTVLHTWSCPRHPA